MKTLVAVLIFLIAYVPADVFDMAHATLEEQRAARSPA
jgi:hypothetical protein